MEDQEHRQKVALFRFGIISALISRISLTRGERERMVREITQKQWEIPGGERTYIGRSTLLRWLKDYREAGDRIEALEPRARKDRGITRCLTPELELALVTLRKELPEATLPVLLTVARERGIVRRTRSYRQRVCTGCSSVTVWTGLRPPLPIDGASRQNCRTICGSPTACTDPRFWRTGGCAKRSSSPSSTTTLAWSLSAAPTSASGWRAFRIV